MLLGARGLRTKKRIQDVFIFDNGSSLEVTQMKHDSSGPDGSGINRNALSGVLRFGFAALAVMCFGAGMLRADDAFMGTWRYNAAKSKHTGPAPYRRVVRKHEPVPNGVKITRDATDTKGKTLHSEVNATFDGKEYPDGSGDKDRNIALTRVDPNTVEMVTKNNGMIVLKQRFVVSGDGKTLTIHEQGINEMGLPYRNEIVFDRP